MNSWSGWPQGHGKGLCKGWVLNWGLIGYMVNPSMIGTLGLWSHTLHLLVPNIKLTWGGAIEKSSHGVLHLSGWLKNTARKVPEFPWQMTRGVLVWGQWADNGNNGRTGLGEETLHSAFPLQQRAEGHQSYMSHFKLQMVGGRASSGGTQVS